MFLRLLLCLFVATLALPAWSQQRERIHIRQDVVVGAGEEAEDVICIGCSVRVLGEVTGDVVTVGGSIELEQDARIRGDAVAIGGGLRLGENARIGADAVAVGGPLDRHPSARIGGDAESIAASAGAWLLHSGLATLLFLGLLLVALTHLALVLLTYAIAGRQRIETVAYAAHARFGPALLAGLGICAAAIALLVIGSLFGPLTGLFSTVVLLGMLATLLLGYAGLSLWVGAKLAPQSAPVAMLALGALLITVLELVPGLGIFLFVFLVVLALGAAALTGWGTADDWLPQQFASRRPAA